MSMVQSVEPPGSIAEPEARAWRGSATSFLFFLSGLLLLAGCTYALLCCSSGFDVSGHAIGSDDAYISYRYSRNWVSGNGLVFNPGERVEGYSNLLYVLLMAIPASAGWNMYAFSVTLNSLFALTTLAIFVAHVRSRLGETSAVVAGLVFALFPSFWIWVSSGLETPLVFLLQVAIWVLVDRLQRRRSTANLALLCTCVTLLVLTRADGFVTGVFASAYLVAVGRRKDGAVSAIALTCVLAALLAWQKAYYGDIWANTYYAKVCSSPLVRLKSSVRELVGVASRQGLSVYLLACVLCAAHAVQRIVRNPGSARDHVRFEHVFPALWVGYWLWIGGDVFADRFLLVLVPMGISVLLTAMSGKSTVMVQRFVVATVMVVPLATIVHDDEYGKTMTRKYDRWVTLGTYLGENRPGKVLATGAAGKVPFFSRLPTIDMLGLNDRHIAHVDTRGYHVGHSKFDPDYVLSRNPDLIAGWLSGDGLDFELGLPMEKYRAAGYGVSLLVNSGPRSLGQYDVIDVSGCGNEEVILLAHSGWRFGVLERSSAGQNPIAGCPKIPAMGSIANAIAGLN
jgi:arabinofuranosyltransferase